MFRIAGLSQRDTHRHLPHAEIRAHTHRAGVYLVGTYVRMKQHRKNPTVKSTNMPKLHLNPNIYGSNSAKSDLNCLKGESRKETERKKKINKRGHANGASAADSTQGQPGPRRGPEGTARPRIWPARPVHPSGRPDSLPSPRTPLSMSVPRATATCAAAGAATAEPLCTPLCPGSAATRVRSTPGMVPDASLASPLPRRAVTAQLLLCSSSRRVY